MGVGAGQRRPEVVGRGHRAADRGRAGRTAGGVVNSKIALIVVQGLILYPALLWKIYQLTRAPENVARWMVTACLACFAASYPLGLLAGDVNQPDPGSIVPLLFQHIFLCGLVYSLACFFLFSALPAARARRRAWLEAVPLSTAILVMAV